MNLGRLSRGEHYNAATDALAVEVMNTKLPILRKASHNGLWTRRESGPTKESRFEVCLWTAKEQSSSSVALLTAHSLVLLVFGSVLRFQTRQGYLRLLTAIKTLINRGVEAGVAEGHAGRTLERVPSSLEGERTQEGGRTSCGESILLRRRLRRPTSPSNPLFFGLSLLLSHSS